MERAERRRPGPLIAIAVCLALAACGDARPPAAGGPGPPRDRLHPNVVLVVLDTARADRLMRGGGGAAATPQLARFARDAVQYTHAHSVAPWTLPAHMSMFTGLLPGQHGATWEAFAEPANATLEAVLERSLRPAHPELLLARRLREAGYATRGISSNAWVAERTGFAEGFDEFTEMWRRGRWPARLQRILAWAVQWLPEPVRHRPELASGEAGQVLEVFRAGVDDTPAQPFFWFFNFIDPHFPYAPPVRWRYRHSDDVALGEDLAAFRLDEMALVAGARPVEIARLAPFYDAEIDYLDAAVGELLAWLRDHDLYDDALIVVTSDHGEQLGERDRFAHQFSVAEELLRIPLWIKYPGNAGAGTRVDDPRVSNLDVYGTILARTLGPGWRREGSEARDLSDMRAFDRRFLVAEYHHAMPFLRAHAERYARFPVDANAVTRRVVYDGQGRSVFVERAGALEVVEETGPAGDARARAAYLSRYLEGLGRGGVRVRPGPLDAESRERLRALGYVD